LSQDLRLLENFLSQSHLWRRITDAHLRACEKIESRTVIGRNCPAPECLWNLAWVPAFAAMTVFVSARHPPTTVIPAQAGIHASFSERNRHRERKALAEQEPHFFTGSFVGMTGCGRRRSEFQSVIPALRGDDGNGHQ